MAVAMRHRPFTPCFGCGELVDGDAAFCPGCGTRQIPDGLLPTTRVETERLARSTNSWILAGLIAVALLLVALWMVMGISG
jgi:RNA polymerase subunit RPABC4/transcription elongation factor Spt4